MTTKMVYLIGSLRNRKVPFIANRLRSRFKNLEVFDNWSASSFDADECWRRYSKRKGLSYREALKSPEAQNIFTFDLRHLDLSDFGLLVMKAGRSAHLESGYLRGQGKPVFALFDSVPTRFDVMANFFTDVFFSEAELHTALRKFLKKS